MDQEDKRRILERHQRALRKIRTFEEEKRIREEAKRRRAQRVRSRPRRGCQDEDDDDGSDAFVRAVEPMRGRGRAASRDVPAEPRASDSPPSASERARVVALARTRVELELGDDRISAPARADLALAVGDHVLVERRAEQVLVQALLPRRSWLARPDPAHPERRLVLAANLDRVMCVVAAKAPRWKPGFVERVLLAASEGRARGLVVVNKVDLLSDPEREELLRALAPFRELADTQAVSAQTGEGLADVVGATRGATCVLVGPSGVGKSSLVNALRRRMGSGPAPHEERATAPVRASDGKGRHTTTAAELVRLENGARWIDTPGVRQFALAGIAPGELAALFPEIVAHARSCRFRDCAHLVEPGCGVLAALEAGRLQERRLASYRRLLGELRHAAR